MKVKVGDRIYDAEDQPVMAILNDADKANIRDMDPDASKYCAFPEGMGTDEASAFMATDDQPEPKRFHGFKMRTGMLLRNATIEMDGVPLKRVRQVVVGGSASGVMEVTISFLSDEIEIEADDGFVVTE